MRAMNPDWPPFLVAVAPNGARRTKADHPALPLTRDEIARDAAACGEAGACMVHLHIRDKQGKHLLDAEAYRDVTRAIRVEAGPDIIVQITTESVGIYFPGYQMKMVREARPEACSLAIREIVPNRAAEREAAAFFAWLKAERIAAQYILYTADEVRRFADLCSRGIVPDDPPFVLYVLGRYAAGQVSDPLDMAPFLAAAERSWHWAVCAFGPKEGAAALGAAALGGHARVGFENNLLLADGTLAENNAALVAQASRCAAALGRPLATGDEARALLSAARPRAVISPGAVAVP